MSLPYPCNLCGHTCTARRDGVVHRRLDGGVHAPPEKPAADLCPWAQCPHRGEKPAVPLVIEDQASFAVVRVPLHHGKHDPIVAVTLRGGYDDAARDARTLHEEAVAGHGPQTHTFDVVAFPHALVAAKLAGFQEQGYEAGYEHGLATAAERLLDWIHQSPFADRLPDLVERVFDVHPDVALAVAASLRCGHELDAPLCAALRASPNPPVVLPDATNNGDRP